MYENTIIAIPCHNEEKNIARTINLVKQTGFSGTILIINDGSTDKTETIARENGAQVINMPKNVGKAGAVFAAFQEGIKQNCDALMTLDADMLEIPKREFDLMLEDAKKHTHEKKSMMIIAYPRELSGIAWVSTDISGIRAYSRNALWKIDKSKLKGKVKGFGIEQFLNLELGNKGESKGFMSGFVAGPALRQGERQNREIQLTLKRLRKRVIKANEERIKLIKEKLARREYKFQQPKSPEEEARFKALMKKVRAAGKKAQKLGYWTSPKIKPKPLLHKP